MPKWKDKLKHGTKKLTREVNNFITDAETKIKAEAARHLDPEKRAREIARAKGDQVRVERERALETIRDTHNAFFGTSWTLEKNRDLLEEKLRLNKQEVKEFTETEGCYKAILNQPKQLASNKDSVIPALEAVFDNIQYQRELNNETPLKSFAESWKEIQIEIGRLELNLLDPQVLERLKVSNRQANQNKTYLLEAIRARLTAEIESRTTGISELSSPNEVSEESVLRAYQVNGYEEILRNESAVRKAIAHEQAAQIRHNSEIQKLQQSCGQEGEGACPSTTSGVSSGSRQKSSAAKHL